MALWIKLRLPGGAVVKKKKKKNLPANTGDARDAGSILGREDPLEEEMATHSSVLAWKIPWTEESNGLQFMGLQRDKTERMNTHARG